MLRSLTCEAIAVSGAAFAQTDTVEIDRPASELNQVLAHPLEIPEGEMEARVVRAIMEARTIAVGIPIRRWLPLHSEGKS